MIYELFNDKKSPKLAVLVDPDKQTKQGLVELIKLAENCKADFFFVGGSLLVEGSFEQTITILKSNSKIPVVIFPGNNYQLSKQADAILFLSLISGRNAEYLIGQHVVAAPLIKESGLEVIPTGYMLIDGGRISATSYITQTLPIPADKTELATATALAGQMLGVKLIYLEAGSGAERAVSPRMIKAVKEAVQIPVIVGGGIRSAEQAEEICKAGADVVVVGNALEKEPGLLMEISLGVHAVKKPIE
ncbi:MAG TPA: geranylgeranylglyceryl/heptaprenylglyceryl phosphate synthase [Chitinophagales bacterium]|nr:geranylgeranylglyceryl/heptaprenylglyceryl phosphate synthase [Chitinophagales bacterium]